VIILILTASLIILGAAMIVIYSSPGKCDQTIDKKKGGNNG